MKNEIIGINLENHHDARGQTGVPACLFNKLEGDGIFACGKWSIHKRLVVARFNVGAMAIKTPVIANNACAIHVKFIPGVSGYVIKVETAILDLLSNPTKHWAMGNQAYQQAKKEFSIDEICNPTINFIQMQL